jgi:hypothetical protein
LLIGFDQILKGIQNLFESGFRKSLEKVLKIKRKKDKSPLSLSVAFGLLAQPALPPQAQPLAPLSLMAC